MELLTLASRILGTRVRLALAFCIVTLAFCAAPGPTGANAAPRVAPVQAAPPGLVAFGREIAGHLRDGEGGQLAALFQSTDVRCPAFDVYGSLLPGCEDVAPGSTISTCLVGRIGGDMGALECQTRLAGLLSTLAEDEFLSTDVLLFTISLTGQQAGGLACPECALLVYSTPTDARIDPEPSIPGYAANIVWFQAIQTLEGWRVHSFALGTIGTGTTNFAILQGGIGDDGQVFFPVDTPGPPDTGSGVVDDRSDALAWPLLAGAVLLAASAAMLFALARRPAH